MNDSPLIIPASIIRRGRSCHQCRHSAEENGLVCRRYPPQVTVLMVPAPPPRVGQMMPQPFATFPPIDPDRPCGEWELPRAGEPVAMASVRDGEAA